MNPKNILAAGLPIPIGLTEEQKEAERLKELEKRRFERIDNDIKHGLDAASLRKLLKTANDKHINSKLKKLTHTEGHIYKYEQVLKEREEEDRWADTR